MRLIVIRGTPDEVGRYDGWWFDLETMNKEAPSLAGWHFGPTGGYETRADGVKAEVYRRIPALGHD